MPRENDNVTRTAVRRGTSASGFTLVEILMVVAILAIVATLAVQGVGRVCGEAEQTVALATLHTVREAFCGTAGASGFLADMKYIPGFSNSTVRIGDLLAAPTNYPAFTNYDRLTGRGWRGPYVQNVRLVENLDANRWGCYPGPDDRRCATDATFEDRGFYAAEFGTTNDPALADPWGNPVVLQMPTNVLDDDECWRFARLVSAGPDGILQTPGAAVPARPDRGDDLVLFLNRADADE